MVVYMRNRLHSICPYFAMFPEEFARQYLHDLTKPGDFVFDPFSGRGTTLLEALLMNRHSVATDINPVAYCITGAKAETPSLGSVLGQLEVLENEYKHFDHKILAQERMKLPAFFKRAFSRSTLLEILFLRRVINWRHNATHRFITALALGSLHGDLKSRSYFSNQMPRTISTKPAYSLNYWREHDLWPEKREVFAILKSRAQFRLSGTIPTLRGHAVLLDARDSSKAFASLHGEIKAVITSPPYLNVTSYEEDQWLRLWFLGHQPRPTYRQISKDDRHNQKTRYWEFLKEVWEGIVPLMQKKSFLVCRLGGKGLSCQELTVGISKSLQYAFPKAHLIADPERTSIVNRQTNAFRPGSKGCRFEIDYVFSLS